MVNSGVNKQSAALHTEEQPSQSGLGLPGYCLIRQLGHGSQGDVYLAERETDGLKVAIKKLNIGSVKNWKEYELFHREAETLSSLNINGVARFYDAIDRLEDHPPCSYIIQEYINGRSLAEMMKNGHRFSVGQVYDILRQLLNILYKLHTHEPPVIHRDIKPSNILLQSLNNVGYEVYLIDFGAVANPQVQSGGSTVAGTYGYMPPEQLMGKPEPASDIYALGAVAVHLFTGKSPAGMEQKDFHLIFEPEMQSFPVELVNTLRSMLEPDPKKRLWNHKELDSLFRSFAQGVYESTGSRRNSMSKGEFDKKLKEVTTYGAPGNLELWQELDDSLPRKQEKIPCLDAVFDSASRNSDGYHFYSCADFEYSSLGKTSEGVPGRVERALVFQSFGVGFLAGAATLCVMVMMGLLRLGFDDLPVVMVISSVTAIIAMIYTTIAQYSERYQKAVKQNMPLKTTSDSRIEYSDETFQVSWNSVQSLLETGRKTIATIVSVEYYKITDDLLEYNRVGAVKNIEASKYAIFSVHRSPLFEIRYSFNPPDDARSEDLIHTIYTHIEPEGHYKVGDPFPILYRIYKEEHDECVDSMPFPLPFEQNECVDSMPFPLPFEDVFTNDNVFCHDIYHMGIQYVQVSKSVDSIKNDPEMLRNLFNKRAAKARNKYGSISDEDYDKQIRTSEKARKSTKTINKDYSFRERADRARKKYGASEIVD